MNIALIHCIVIYAHSHGASFEIWATTMQNEAGEFVDIYIPRRCAVTNRLIGAKDHASIQIQFVDLDPNTGRMIGGSKKTYDLSGSIRSMVKYISFNAALQGEVDDCINMLAVRDKMLPP